MSKRDCSQDTIRICPSKRKKSWFMVSRQIIECPNVSPTAKGYYAMYVSECIEWNDIPKEYANELDAIELEEEVE